MRLTRALFSTGSLSLSIYESNLKREREKAGGWFLPFFPRPSGKNRRKSTSVWVVKKSQSKCTDGGGHEVLHKLKLPIYIPELSLSLSHYNSRLSRHFGASKVIVHLHSWPTCCTILKATPFPLPPPTFYHTAIGKFQILTKQPSFTPPPPPPPSFSLMPVVLFLLFCPPLCGVNLECFSFKRHTALARESVLLVNICKERKKIVFYL